MPRRFGGKAVLVTGAASGIGRAVALALAAEGGMMLLADRNLEGAAATADAIAQRGGTAGAIAYDAMLEGSPATMVDAAVAVHGRLDALVNIAGVYQRAHFEDLAATDWNRVIRINLTSLFEIARQALPALIESRGNIVNTASIAALDGLAYAAPYAAAKAGVISLSKSLAAEFAHRGVRCNVICPGRVRTEIGAGLAPVENGRPELLSRPPRLLGLEAGASADDLAATYAFLASDDARFISGAVLVVDGAVRAG